MSFQKIIKTFIHNSLSNLAEHRQQRCWSIDGVVNGTAFLKQRNYFGQFDFVGKLPDCKDSLII